MGTAIKHPVPDWVKQSIVIMRDRRYSTYMLSPVRLSVRLSVRRVYHRKTVEFRDISRVSEAITAKRMKTDPYCQRRNCSPLNVLFSDVYDWQRCRRQRVNNEWQCWEFPTVTSFMICKTTACRESQSRESDCGVHWVTVSWVTSFCSHHIVCHLRKFWVLWFVGRLGPGRVELVDWNTLGHFTFWLRPWLRLLAQTKH